ncbi:hypothetical protein SDC9_119736 [bioreactor metagenome]|uniref:Uncharacterized protein n=1 Tax=bioreactor metagenome TaxID=1076179 RepID=A0A645C4R9_9ZZZZ
MSKAVCRLLNQTHRPAGFIIPVQAAVRPLHRREILLPVAQKVPPLQQLLFLAGTQLRPLQLLNLKRQAVHFAGLFRLVHPKGVHLAAQLRHRAIGGAVFPQRALQSPKGIQIRAVPLLVQKLLPVVLAVDIQKLPAKHPQLRYRHRPSVDPAEVFSVCVQLPLENQKALLVHRPAALGKAGKVRLHSGKLRTDHCPLAAGANQVPGGSAPQHRAQSVNDNGFSRAGFSGEGVEARAEMNVRLLDDCNVFNVQQLQHGFFPLFSVMILPFIC